MKNERRRIENPTDILFIDKNGKAEDRSCSHPTVSKKTSSLKHFNEKMNRESVSV
jgi:hypothetical protein